MEVCGVAAAVEGVVYPIVGRQGGVDGGGDSGGFGESEMHQRQGLDVKVIYVEVVVLIQVALETDGYEASVAAVGREIDVFGIPDVGGEVGEGAYRLKMAVGTGTIHNAYLYGCCRTFESEADLHGNVPYGVDIEVGQNGCGLAGVVVVGIETE